jgi:hypothetical protein
MIVASAPAVSWTKRLIMHLAFDILKKGAFVRSRSSLISCKLRRNWHHRFHREIASILQFLQVAPIFAEMGLFGTPHSLDPRNGSQPNPLQSSLSLSYIRIINWIFFRCSVPIWCLICVTNQKLQMNNRFRRVFRSATWEQTNSATN